MEHTKNEGLDLYFQFKKKMKNIAFQSDRQIEKVEEETSTDDASNPYFGAGTFRKKEYDTTRK